MSIRCTWQLRSGQVRKRQQRQNRQNARGAGEQALLAAVTEGETPKPDDRSRPIDWKLYNAGLLPSSANHRENHREIVAVACWKAGRSSFRQGGMR